MRKQVVHTDRVPPARVPLTRQVCENLEAILEAAGSALDRVVNVTWRPEHERLDAGRRRGGAAAVVCC